MFHPLLKTGIFILCAVFALVWFVRYVEKNGLFHPTREMPPIPISIGVSFEDVNFKTEDGIVLNGWFIGPTESVTRPMNPQRFDSRSESAGGYATRATLLFFHGNAGNISHRTDKILMFHKMGLNVFIIDYRGYGKSDGAPSERGIYKDALAAYGYLLTRKDVDPLKIVGYGESLGGVAAIYLASQKPLAALIAESSFSSVADVTTAIFPFVPPILLSSKMDSAKRAKEITIPKLFIHSVNDEIIPYRLGKKLFDTAAEPKEFLEVWGGHNTNHIDSREIFANGIGSFLKRLNLL